MSAGAMEVELNVTLQLQHLLCFVSGKFMNEKLYDSK